MLLVSMSNPECEGAFMLGGGGAGAGGDETGTVEVESEASEAIEEQEAI